MLRAFFYKAIVATNPTTAAPKNEVESAPILYNPRRCAGIVAPPGKELDPDHVPQFGLVAEEVEKVNPDLVAREEDGKAMTIRDEAVNAMC